MDFLESVRWVGTVYGCYHGLLRYDEDQRNAFPVDPFHVASYGDAACNVYDGNPHDAVEDAFQVASWNVGRQIDGAHPMGVGRCSHDDGTVVRYS